MTFQINGTLCRTLTLHCEVATEDGWLASVRYGSSLLQCFYYIHCLLYPPNCLFDLQVMNVFEPDLVLNQLKYSGMLETVKIRKAGFPIRRTYQDFAKRCIFTIELSNFFLDPFSNSLTVNRKGLLLVFQRHNIHHA